MKMKKDVIFLHVCLLILFLYYFCKLRANILKVKFLFELTKDWPNATIRDVESDLTS